MARGKNRGSSGQCHLLVLGRDKSSESTVAHFSGHMSEYAEFKETRAPAQNGSNPSIEGMPKED